MPVKWINSAMYSWNRDALEAAPEMDGVYAILSKHQRLYIGKGNIKQRLISHWNKENGTDSCLWGNYPALCCWEICSTPDAREAELVRDFPTRCNSVMLDVTSVFPPRRQ